MDANRENRNSKDCTDHLCNGHVTRISGLPVPGTSQSRNLGSAVCCCSCNIAPRHKNARVAARPPPPAHRTDHMHPHRPPAPHHGIRLDGALPFALVRRNASPEFQFSRVLPEVRGRQPRERARARRYTYSVETATAVQNDRQNTCTRCTTADTEHVQIRRYSTCTGYSFRFRAPFRDCGGGSRARRYARGAPAHLTRPSDTCLCAKRP